jgi:pimeloyl-ACP methyl ester carboxylesterase
VRLDCPEVDSAMEHSADLPGRKSFDASAGAFRSCASRLRAEGVDLAGYSLPERVDDLEAARRALGYHRVDLLSESAGTRTAMIYAVWGETIRRPRRLQVVAASDRLGDLAHISALDLPSPSATATSRSRSVRQIRVVRSNV